MMTITINNAPLKKLTKTEREIFHGRVAQQLPDAHYTLSQLYGDRPDFDEWLQKFLDIVTRAYAQRPAELRLLDIQRTQQPDWYQRADQIGYICYADRFAGDLPSIIDKIPYLQELGITYLHLMPLLQPRPEPNDGGYAVQDYRAIDKRLGTMRDLKQVTQALRQAGISLCTDLVCNHTAVEHEWAQKALAGESQYQDYYFTFPDRTLPDQYDQHLREIFPETDPGNFQFYPDMPIGDDKQKGGWVWTTFHDYQWDLNYQNPAVFGEMLDIILNLANHGVEIIRMDAVAFMWKQMGTVCENLPQAHAILQAFRTLTLIACPGLIFKAEAIVAPEDVVPYFGRGRMAGKECEIAYHNSLMVLLWSMLAEQKAVLATYSLLQLPELPQNAAWVTYVRCHDDIGWAIMDDNAAAVGLNGFWHRSFLSDFYSGQFPGSWARGDVFQFNPQTLDRRISGAGASLAGLEIAQEQGSAYLQDLAVRRLLLIHSVIFMYGGIPLIYMGDELGLTNDYSYLDDPERRNDNRWLQRPWMDWDRAEERTDLYTTAGRLFQGIKHLCEIRKNSYMLHAEAAVTPVWTHNDHVFGLERRSPRGRLLLLANVTSRPQTISGNRLTELGYGQNLRDKLTDRSHPGWLDLTMEPYQTMWLVPFQGMLD